jgi:tetratricopeptide (TPR) repeat protein
MNSGSRIALGMAIALGGAALTAAVPAAAQVAAPVRSFTLTKQERAAILPVQTAVLAGNFAAAAAALPAAEASAGSPDARYFVGQYKLRIGIGTGNTYMQNQGVEMILASGVTPSGDLSEMYSNQAALAAGKGDLKKAEAAYSSLVELRPNDSMALAMLAEVKNDRGKFPEATALLDRAITVRQAAGQPVPEGWYKRALKTALDAKMAPETLKFSRLLVAAYPDSENWRDAALAYRDVGGFDPSARLDVYRLMRAAKALHGERDYQEFANAFNAANLPGEAKSALDEGVSRKIVDPLKPAFKALITQTAARAATGKAGLGALATKASAAATGTAALGAADAYLGQGDYSKAAELYTAALQKGSVDPNVANLRLGEALALAGRRPEAEAALRAVTGTWADIAGLWLAWLARRA